MVCKHMGEPCTSFNALLTVALWLSSTILVTRDNYYVREPTLIPGTEIKLHSPSPNSTSDLISTSARWRDNNQDDIGAAGGGRGKGGELSSPVVELGCRLLIHFTWAEPCVFGQTITQALVGVGGGQ